MIVVSPLFSIDELLTSSSEFRSLPPVELVRPSSCPSCGSLAYNTDGRLGIVGHGSYVRKVSGLDESNGPMTIRVRRFRCRECRQTISVLPDVLHPRRRYAAAAIIDALRRQLFDGEPVRRIRRRFTGDRSESTSWRTLQRWRSDLFLRLWGWLGARFGVRGKACSREEGFRRLVKLEAERAVPGSGVVIGLAGTVHVGLACWQLGHEPPESIALRSPGRSELGPSTTDVRSSSRTDLKRRWNRGIGRFKPSVPPRVRDAFGRDGFP